MRGRPRTLPPAISVGTAVLAGAWSAAVIDSRLAGATLPGPSSLHEALPYLMPALLVALLLFRRQAFSQLDELVTIWVTLVLLAALLLPSVVSGSLTPLAFPAVAATSVAARRWPAAAMLLIGAFSASYGSLQAFWNFPVEKATDLIIAALWTASLTALLSRGSRPNRVSLSMVLLGAYLLITAIQVPLSPNRQVAVLGFKDSALFMLVVPLIAYAGWKRETHERIAKGILLVGLLAAVYALFRVVAGPAVAEYRQMATTVFNFSDGKLKPGGSFGSGQSLGTWMATVVPFAFASVFTFRGAWRILAGLTAGLCTVAALESQLRIGLVGLIVGLVVVLVLHQSGRGFPGLRLGSTMLAAAVGVAALTAGLSSIDNHGTHTYKALLNPTADPSFKAREYKWSQALSNLDTHPFGFGIGTASYAEQVAGSPFLDAVDSNVDNGFLRVALEQGFVIMVVFGIALLAVWLALIRGGLRERDQLGAGLVIGAAGTLGSFLIVMVTEDATYSLRSMITWMIVGLGMAVLVSRQSGQMPLYNRRAADRNRLKDQR